MYFPTLSIAITTNNCGYLFAYISFYYMVTSPDKYCLQYIYLLDQHYVFAITDLFLA